MYQQAEKKLWQMLVFASTDGASNIRSTKQYRGVMARGGIGDSLFARLWRDLDNRHSPIAMQCLPHLGNSSWEKTLKFFLVVIILVQSIIYTIVTLS